ncbi:UDP-N-acetylmuramate:L-alanyl-gamma-D-glutamyl-meso-diaminopimelate ligase [Corticibacter populi]|uniref:UDP-N-acetylmuramate--L-alanyl-gamma-D-glutamyl-meso-2,6-diaminoheptandioate ligase n=1 Tax=Corticibacter populi TaxID=1550736 RepID=A0A3M6QNM2_9BURK|nr:UDP-N-acetylmuramate:L-alanyl-gamma-D-glutamyl-meso-diaminopimelate ligase [Corticibacter populi]RMX04119.1 UDP-N-acetylmuramate:L-alanyl-gamma-D-glutamyl-meso-diaminopimelate ligase [Corticibacter populi]RZS33130.1 UDP-N-acetylmuramate: L-alanyl-gamma-D-glutamyl-meso-diaminopimelate ligase [Corticibacter populi]
MHIHILGICGTFMAGIAALAKAAGHTVTGCDAQVYPPMSDQLRALGIDIIEGYGAEQLALRPDHFVIGNVVSRARLSGGSPRYPLMEAILDAGLPYTSGPQWLAEHILPGRHVLAVAGTHGKTTTASMLAWILQANGHNPGFLIGGMPGNFGVSARSGRTPRPDKPGYFVIEADEYDTAFFDKRSKFLHYRPRTLVLNNLEFDHADIFENLAAIERQFNHLLRTVPGTGRVISNADDANLPRVLQQGCWSELRHFGSAAVAAVPAQTYSAAGTEQSFNVRYEGERVGHVEWTLSGRHNQLNALAAIAAAEHIGIAPAAAADALSRFEGVRRRMELRGTAGGIAVYDDFAHHPTAIATTLEGLRHTLAGGARVLAVFEPRSNTMKLGTMAAQLPAALTAADAVFAYDNQLGWDVAGALAPLGDKAQTHHDIDALVRSIVAAARPGDHIVCMSNGSFGGIHERLLAALRQAGSGTA